MPGELMFARSVSVENLRPWEYWQMDSEEYYLIVQLQAVWREELEAERAALRQDQVNE